MCIVKQNVSNRWRNFLSTTFLNIANSFKLKKLINSDVINVRAP